MGSRSLVNECTGDIASIDLRQPVAHTLSRVVASDHTPMRNTA
jgi:hypothetical protein